MRAIADIARAEEARCALGTSEVAIESLHVGGGIASRGEPRTWVNTAVGLGMNGAVGEVDIARVMTWYHEAGHDAHVELCPYADATLVKGLAQAGFTANRFETVWFRELRAREHVVPPQAPSPAIRVAPVDPADEYRVQEVARVISQGFAKEGAATRPEEIAVTARCVRHARTTMFAAYIDDACVGGGGLEMLGELAALYSLAVDERFRRMGVQQALIAARLTRAIERGATLATIGGPPGMGTERNARRFGFQAAYTKVMMVKPPAA